MQIAKKLNKFKGVIFDMDGTLTVPCLDFSAMRKAVGIPKGSDILLTLNTFPEPKRSECYAIIDQFEQIGREKLELMNGVFELMEYLENKSIPKALFTRNSQKSIDHFLEKSNLSFQAILSREYHPPKPHPEGALHICSQWNITPDSCLFVGDGEHDIESGMRAGNITVLLVNDENTHLKDKAHYSIQNLEELKNFF
eukprot:TRINITY_DN3596_c0_g1_i2.p1 TRINITY_DN3596_c0_g1~~TRINITY_DN3596_c0_g1_i2.p1  ORF type:complete len:197 (-),score=17.53 TRINITY_DN3596_c0_g1_i2:41-631(-)